MSEGEEPKTKDALGRTEQTKRIRGRALQRLRARLLADNPLCVLCRKQGRVTPAIEIDHVVALTNGGTNDESNLQNLCAECHELKTLDDLGQKPRQSIGVDGWPTNDYGSGPRWIRAG